MRSEILAYLESGYYAQGLDLLRRCHAATQPQLRQFEQYIGRPYVPAGVEDRLKGLLRSALAGMPEDSISDFGFRISESPTPKRNPKSDTLPFWSSFFNRHTDPPEAVMALRSRIIMLHKEQSRIHPLMAEAARAGHKKEAYELAQQRLDGQRQLDDLYDAVREWEETGKLPSAPQRNEAAESVMDKMKRAKYLNERLCRIRKWLRLGYRTKVLKGEKVKVLLDLLEIQELETEQLDKTVELKQVHEELGLL